jgi:hypothetical protein
MGLMPAVRPGGLVFATRPGFLFFRWRAMSWVKNPHPGRK